MAQAHVILPAPNGLDEELMGTAIHKLGKLGTLEGNEIGVYIVEAPEGKPDDVTYLEFRASVIPYLELYGSLDEAL